MSISSMTGFARTQGELDGTTWTWELKCVNGKGFDVRCRVPSGFDAVDNLARKYLSGSFNRGNMSAGLMVSRPQNEGGFRINEDLLDQLLMAMEEIRDRIPDAALPRLDGLMNLRGVIEPVEQQESEEQKATLETAILESLKEAAKSLADMRAHEGAQMEAVLRDHIDHMERLVKDAGKNAATQPAAILARLVDQVNALVTAVPALPEERIAQEAAILATKADIREELDRLNAHIESARKLLGQGGPIGRKLDFLCQEFNREANTLCSKSSDVELSRTGLELKAVIDQLREQVQNIE